MICYTGYLPEADRVRLLAEYEERRATRPLPPEPTPMPEPTPKAELAAAKARLDAFRRLIEIAKGDTHQCAHVADFLLAWWNAKSCGGFDLTDLWAVDEDIARDMLTVCELIATIRSYPDALGFKADFGNLVALWRPAYDWWETLTEQEQAAWKRRTRPLTEREAYAEWWETTGRHNPDHPR